MGLVQQGYELQLPAVPQPSLAYGPGWMHGSALPVSLQHFVGVH